MIRIHTENWNSNADEFDSIRADDAAAQLRAAGFVVGVLSGDSDLSYAADADSEHEAIAEFA